MFADLSPNHEILKEVITKKAVSHGQQRQLTKEIVSDYGLSVARDCRLPGLARSQFYYRSRRDELGGHNRPAGAGRGSSHLRFPEAAGLPETGWQDMEPQAGVPGLQAAQTQQKEESNVKVAGTGEAAAAPPVPATLTRA
ncbi:hypothetical protein ACMA1I_05885 [Pontibacter sp. 13R65]|uniref:hypothetical protein n=1 Tax=Pontibacter sp. 13R65 TaxID=3127458 RepID=UPI00301E0E47